jgi:hypothetical protein
MESRRVGHETSVREYPTWKELLSHLGAQRPLAIFVKSRTIAVWKFSLGDRIGRSKTVLKPI